MKNFFVYIMANKQRGTLYTGVTSSLVQRVYQHKQGVISGFTSKYELYKLVYYEEHANAFDAIQREKQIKKWRRLWKIELIEEFNPCWNDLYDEINENGSPLPRG